MDAGETYEKAPRLAPTRPSSHAWPGTTLAQSCCTSGVARCAAEMAGARLERRAVSAHAVPKAEGANQGSEFAPLGPTTPGAAGADYSS
jgi:hypothetical protein